MRNIYGHGTVVWLKRRGKERKKEQSLELCFVGEKGRKEKEGVTEYPRTTRAKSLQYNGTSRKLYFPTVGRQRR